MHLRRRHRAPLISLQNMQASIRNALAILIFILCIVHRAEPQTRVSVGFYNVENLCDTLPSMFYDDAEWTPGGERRWNGEKYQNKLNNIARVIDDAGFDILGLAEVENESVVRDLVMTLSDDYNYIHRTTTDSRGMDLALIYKGDKFFPDAVRQIRSGTGRQLLHVVGSLSGERVNIVVCHLPSRSNQREYRQQAIGRLRQVADSLAANDTAELIVMGDFNCVPGERIFRSAFGKLSNGIYAKSLLMAGIDPRNAAIAGSYCYGGRWMLYDNILLSLGIAYGQALTYVAGGVFVRDYMLFGSGEQIAFPSLGARLGYPLRTFSSGVYTAGYSDHLPVYVILEIER